MSAEGKKKRGISGAANAKSISFRYNGGGAYPSHYRKTLAAIPGLPNRVGRPAPGSAFDK